MSALGGIIQAGAELLGAGFNHQEGEQNRQIQWDVHRENQALQREFAQNGIRWRTEDAKAAGLHPLFALTGNGASYTPQGIQVGNERPGDNIGRAGQHLGREVSAAQDRHTRDLQIAQLKALEAQSQRDFAHASYYASEAARRAQQENQTSPIVLDAYNENPNVVLGPSTRGRNAVESHPLYQDAVQLRPDEMSSRDSRNPGSTSGRDHPAMRQFLLDGDFQIMLPATGGGGVPEEIDVSMLPMVLGANLERFGWRWLIDLAGYMTGQSPRYRRERGSLESFLRRKFESGSQEYRQINEFKQRGLK